METWRRQVLKIQSSNEEFDRCYDQGVQDMAALRLPLAGSNSDHMVFVPAAGLPWFVALFGRDTLIVSLQTMIVYPEFAAATLAVLGRLQARSATTTATPSRARSSTSCASASWRTFKVIRTRPTTAPPMRRLSIRLRCTRRGAPWEMAACSSRMSTAEACLDWIDKYGDLDGDGFQEYQTR